MKLEWDGHIGPAAIISIVGSLGVLVSIGIAWGITTSKIDTAAVLAAEAKTAAKELIEQAARRDRRVADQAERLGKIETSLTFIVPAIVRIESKIDTAAAK